MARPVMGMSQIPLDDDRGSVVPSQAPKMTPEKYAALKAKYTPAVDDVRSQMYSDPVFMTWQLLQNFEHVFREPAVKHIHMVCGHKACRSLAPSQMTHGSAIALLVKAGSPVDIIASQIKDFAESNGWTVHVNVKERMILLQPAK